MAQNRLLDDLARLFTDAAGMAQGVRREAEGVVKAQFERLIRDMDVVTPRGIRGGSRNGGPRPRAERAARGARRRARGQARHQGGRGSAGDDLTQAPIQAWPRSAGFRLRPRLHTPMPVDRRHSRWYRRGKSRTVQLAVVRRDSHALSSEGGDSPGIRQGVNEALLRSGSIGSTRCVAPDGLEFRRVCANRVSRNLPHEPGNGMSAMELEVDRTHRASARRGRAPRKRKRLVIRPGGRERDFGLGLRKLGGIPHRVHLARRHGGAARARAPSTSRCRRDAAWRPARTGVAHQRAALGRSFRLWTPRMW